MPDEPMPRHRRARFTAVEKKILDGLAHGKTGAQICRELGISRPLYQVYLRMLRRYLDVDTTVEAVYLYARGEGDPDDGPAD